MTDGKRKTARFRANRAEPGTGTGTYVLILRARRRFIVRIGSLGMLAGEPGYYLYIGSAFGPGGLTARLAHHCRIATRLHWHIDYLRSALPVVEIWRACHAVRREWLWVKTMGALPGARVPMPGFGASDHRGATHLFRFDRKPSLGTFAAALEAGGARKETLSRHVPGE